MSQQYSTFMEKEYSGAIEYNKHIGPIDAMDEKNARSLIAQMDEETRKRAKAKGVQKVLEMTDEQVEAELKPTLVLRRLRTSFWLEYDRIAYQVYSYSAPNKFLRKQFSIERAVEQICTVEYFKEHVMKNDLAFGYILRVPPDYLTCINEALQHGVQKLREILDFPLYKKKFNNKNVTIRTPEGEDVYEPDHKTADIILKAFAMLDLRAKGAIAQKLNIEGMMTQKNVNVNLQAGMNKVTTVNAQALGEKLLSIEDLDQKLNALSRETVSMMEDPKLTFPEEVMMKRKQQELLEKQMEEIEKKPS